VNRTDQRADLLALTPKWAPTAAEALLGRQAGTIVYP
jgi:hypothetical protein